MWFGGAGAGTNVPANPNNQPPAQLAPAPQANRLAQIHASQTTPIDQGASQPTGDMSTGHQSTKVTTGTNNNKIQQSILQPPVQPQQKQQQQQQQQQQCQPPTASSMLPSSGRPEKISFHLKTSIFTRRITIDSDKMALGLIKQLAIAFLNEIYFQQQYPAKTYIGDYIRKHFSNNDNLNSLYERLVLRKYNSDQGTFVPFNTVSDIGPESYISIEISERQPVHLLSPSSGTTTATSHTTNAQYSSTSSTPSTYQLKISHDFHPESYFIPTHCASCSALIKGVFRQGFQCSYCKKHFCPKCKVKAETTGDGCLALTPTTSTSTVNSCNVSTSSTATTSGNLLPPQNSSQNHSSCQPGVNSNNDNPENNAHANEQNNNNGDCSNKLELNHSNMFKRKSASNLLHFNIANPFKSHHGPQSSQHQTSQQQQPVKEADKPSSKSIRGSAGALDPVLQQLSKQMRDHQQQNQTAYSIGQKQQSKNNNDNNQDENANNLLNVHAAQLSSSHQNLYTINDKDDTKSIEIPAGSSSVHQSPSKANVSQLSNSARTSARDLSHAASPTRRDQVSNHAFVSMDWIQVSGDPACGVCNKSLKSQHHQPPAMCKVCKLQVHSQCQNLALADCLSRIAESSRAAAERREYSNQMSDDKTGLKGTSSNVSRDNIRLHRLAPSVKHIKRPDSTKPIIEGWLQHKTLSDEQSRKHYWRLDDTDITLYENDTSTRYFKAIALNKITRVISASSLPKRIKEDILLSDFQHQDVDTKQVKSANNSPAKLSELKDQMNAVFGFEISTGSVYLVQASDADEASRWKGSLEAITAKRALESAKKEEEKKQFQVVEQTKQQGVEKPKEQAVNNTNVNQQVAEKQKQSGQRHHHHHASSNYRGQHKTYTDPNRSRLYNRPRIIIRLDPMSIPDHWIEGKYLIERDRIRGVGFEELGSGQFGKVYAAISEIKAEDHTKGLWSGVPVAIKEISKARFDLRQQAKLKNEANILSRLDHPGVIILERVHDLPDKIYIVMEQLEDDMLEMIVSTSEKRLTERVTKFLTYQILEALKYLHAQNIAHCDLKPENVLLVERRSQFPQIKLCDFGFAKIIEDNSFRSSLVGTPAYLAPEVVKGERYNRSVDLWSVGVIVYVSLSGEFPFNEGENIHDQISRANFMYPDQPWAKISNQAKNFINSLLRVNSDKRLSANRAQMDDWIQDYQLWCDLCELEMRVGKRWVTDDADFERWSRYAKERNIQVPRSAVQLHEQLVGD